MYLNKYFNLDREKQKEDRKAIFSKEPRQAENNNNKYLRAKIKIKSISLDTTEN